MRLGWATFADAARATDRVDGAPPSAQVDVGVGLRVRVPGAGGVVRVDVATGLRDGARAVTVGWQR